MNSSSLLSGVRGLGPQLLTASVASRLPVIVTWGLVGAIGVQSAVIVRDLIPEQAPTAAASAQLPAAGSEGSRRVLDVQSVIKTPTCSVKPIPPSGCRAIQAMRRKPT